MSGWIKTHRKLLDNPVVCKDSDHFYVWMYLLLNATHSNYDAIFMGKRITLQAGQLLTGRKSISAKLNISESKVQRILKTFEIEQQIEQQTSSQNRLISILNWSNYQGSEQQIEQQLNNERTTSEQRVNTNKNVKKEKNENNTSESYSQVFDDLWNRYPRKESKAGAYKKFKAYSKKYGEDKTIKSIERYIKDVEHTEVRFIKKLNNFFNDSFEDYLNIPETKQETVREIRPLTEQEKLQKWG